MKIIIAGDGKVGSALTRQLSGEGYDLTIIDKNAALVENTVERYDVMAVHGNCASMDTLKQADVENADLLIAATNADEVNLLCCMTAHGMNEKLHTIARIRNPEYTEQIYQMREQFGLSMIVNPERQAAAEIEQLLRYPGFLKRDTFAKGRIEIVELRIDAGSKLCNLALLDLNSTVGCQVLVCAVLRNGTATIPSGNFIIKEGDRIFVTGPTDVLTQLLKNLGIITHKVKRAVLCGGGRISHYLAQNLLKVGIRVEIIENNYDRCLELAAQLPDANIVHGDATNQEFLEEEHLDQCSALVSLTGLDELNMIISMYAKSIGIPQVISKVDHLENSKLLDTLSIGSVICPKDLCSNSIVRYVRAMRDQTGAALTVHRIADGQAEAIEFLVDEHTLNCDRPLKELRLRKNVLVACISSGSRTEIPNGDSSFSVGDHVVVVSSGDHVIYQLNDIFE